jgi:zinc and cadmium transporter
VARNFIYIGASDLIPEIKAHADFATNILHFIAFFLGALFMLVVKVAFGS